MAGLQLRAFASALCSSWSSVDPRGVFSDEMIQTESNWQSDLEKTPQLGTALRLHFKETPSTETPSSPTQAPSGAQQAFLCLPTLCCQHLLLFVCLFVTGDANHNLAFAKQVLVLGAKPQPLHDVVMNSTSLSGAHRTHSLLGTQSPPGSTMHMSKCSTASQRRHQRQEGFLEPKSLPSTK